MTQAPLAPNSTDAYEYVAKQPIDINGVRAFNPGDPVPAQHVEDYNLADLVANRGSAEARDVSEPFDPSDHSVEDVAAHLSAPETSQAERERVLAAERTGKARKTILGDDAS